MADFKASDPRNKTLGSSMQSVLGAMQDEVGDIIAGHNLQRLQPDKWYAQQDYLDVFNDIFNTQRNVMHNLVAIGIEVLETAEFPPNISSLEDALLSLDDYYHLNNKDEKGGWRVKMTGPTSAVCVSTTPFPSDMEYGILYAMTRRFVPKGYTFTVKYDGHNMTRKGPDNPCTYTVTWQKKQP